MSSEMNVIREHESDTRDQLYPREKPSATFFRPGRSGDRLPVVPAGISGPVDPMGWRWTIASLNLTARSSTSRVPGRSKSERLKAGFDTHA
jgi:hypothetical protein